ncbi:MAG TPA: hypothetical protein VFT99_24015, partial [Roseiflexaceae bacterium]|nr:hypothetical protein [Roseiflexaceae bacterium]
ARTTELRAGDAPDVLGGVVTISAPAGTLDEGDWDGVLYCTEPPRQVTTRLRAIPYFAWDGREAGAMRVWVRESDTSAG